MWNPKLQILLRNFYGFLEGAEGEAGFTLGDNDAWCKLLFVGPHFVVILSIAPPMVEKTLVPLRWQHRDLSFGLFSCGRGKHN